MIRGENGALAYTAESVGDARVALFFALVRGIDDGRIAELMAGCFGDQAESDLAVIVADLFVMAIQTRDCRGGKGERGLSYQMLLHLFHSYPDTVLQMVGLLGEYGYYKDYFQLYELTGDKAEYAVLRNKITDLVANQLIADEAMLEGGSVKKMSLCAKYCPREGKHFDTGKASAFAALVEKLFPASEPRNNGKKQYRQLVAKLTKVLDVPEVKMCGKRFSELEFAKVPSVCTKKFLKAFLNEQVEREPAAEEEETGNRHPDDEDRIVCRQNLRQAAIDQKVKGKQLYPHEVVDSLYRSLCSNRVKVSSLQKVVLDAQWKDIRRNLLAQLAAAAGEGASAPSISLGKLIPMSDVSGSMSGTPMLVSIALGILVSEVNHPAFRDRVMTFDSNPDWVSLSGLSTIAEKVQAVAYAAAGTSTDINKAFELIRDAVREHRLPAEEVPDLIIFSDMQFDEAAGADRCTQLELVRKMFADVGVEISGIPYAAPRIIFWNLHGDTVGFPAQADDANVQMLSGFSPSLLKAVLEGGELEETVDVAKAKPTPYETLRKVLDDARYHPVRKLLSASSEGALAAYHFEVPVNEI
jgi:hypothetical protein